MHFVETCGKHLISKIISEILLLHSEISPISLQILNNEYCHSICLYTFFMKKCLTCKTSPCNIVLFKCRHTMFVIVLFWHDIYVDTLLGQNNFYKKVLGAPSFLFSLSILSRLLLFNFIRYDDITLQYFPMYNQSIKETKWSAETDFNHESIPLFRSRVYLNDKLIQFNVTYTHVFA